MRVLHADGEPGRATDAERVLAADIEVADSLFAQARGLTFRRSVPDGYALVFRFDGQATRRLHTVCVPFDIDAVWVANGVVQRVRRLSAWTGYGSAVADTVVELPAGAGDGITTGDRVWVAP